MCPVNNPSKGAIITRGTFSGDGTDNKAIAHSIGDIPYLVIITGTTNTTSGFILANEPTKINAWGANADVVTAMTATNFYVANNTGADPSTNANGITYRWFAIGYPG